MTGYRHIPFAGGHLTRYPFSGHHYINQSDPQHDQFQLTIYWRGTADNPAPHITVTTLADYGANKWTTRASVPLQPTKTDADAVKFFYDHAGYAVRQGETTEAARARCAEVFAGAEREAVSRGYWIRWEVDADADTTPTDNYFVSGNPQWRAALHDASGDVVASLCGIDFAEDYTAEGTPQRDAYARVVFAELALEAQ